MSQTLQPVVLFLLVQVYRTRIYQLLEVDDDRGINNKVLSSIHRDLAQHRRAKNAFTTYARHLECTVGLYLRK